MERTALSVCPILHGIVFRVVGHRKQVCKHHLGNALRAVGWHVGHDDAVPVGCVDVHHVVSSGQHADVSEPWQLFYFMAAKYDLIRQHDIGIGSPCHRLSRIGAVENGDVPNLFQFLP